MCTFHESHALSRMSVLPLKWSILNKNLDGGCLWGKRRPRASAQHLAFVFGDKKYHKNRERDLVYRISHIWWKFSDKQITPWACNVAGHKTFFCSCLFIMNASTFAFFAAFSSSMFCFSTVLSCIGLCFSIVLCSSSTLVGSMTPAAISHAAGSQDRRCLLASYFSVLQLQLHLPQLQSD